MKYVPAWQSVHWLELLAPVAVWYVPEWHDRQVLEFGEARTVEYVPVMQLVHRLDMVTPEPVLYLPVWQL